MYFFQVTGTGKAGRILKSDVLAFMEPAKADPVPQPETPPAPAATPITEAAKADPTSYPNLGRGPVRQPEKPPTPAAKPPAPAATPIAFPQSESREIPIRGRCMCLPTSQQMSTRLYILIRLHTCRGAGVQKAMYQSMTASLQIPHLVYCDEVEMDGLRALRTRVKQMRKDIAISFMPFLIKVVPPYLCMNIYYTY